MRIPNIYTPLNLTIDADIVLDGQAAQHLIKVLRMKPDQEINLFNGDNVFYHGQIAQVEKKSLRVNIKGCTTSNTESPLKTHLGQVMSRGDRMDYVIQKSTEMGVTEITPLTSERCELKLKGERESKKIQHWQQIAISAAEQCGRASVPKINSVESCETWIKKVHVEPSETTLNLVLHHRDQQHLSQIQSPPQCVNLLIGPEGGLTAEEIALAQSLSFKASTFGPRVLRTETAPVAALALLQWLWGDYQ